MSQSKAPKTASMPTKRKADPSENPEKSSSKKRKKFAGTQDDSLLDTEAGVNLGLALMDPQLLADYLSKQVTRFGKDLSSVELSDLHIPPQAIQDTTSFTETRTLEKLPEFLEKFAKKPESLGEAPKKKGAPHTIIVTGAGLRAADTVRAVRKYQKKGNTVAKLFAKHIKIDESTKFLQEHKTGIAVGTPVRLNDLIENGSLHLDKLERIVVDASHIDQKKRGVLDMKEITMPLARWLARKEFKERYTADGNQLCLFFF